MTQAELWMLFISGAGALGTIVAVVLSNRDAKRTMAQSYGSLTKEVSENSRRLGVAEETIAEHTEAIGYLKGKSNGHAAGRAH